MTLNIIFENDQFLVIDKPAGLVVNPSQTQKEKTLADILQSEHGINLERGGIVHRLDRDTSGLLLVAKTQAAFEALQSQFKERKVKKEYLALVHGYIMERGVVDASIARNPRNREKFSVTRSPGRSHFVTPSRWPHGLLEGAREAVTEYEPVGRLQFTGDRLQKIFSDFNEQSSRLRTKIQMRKLLRMKYDQFTLVACRPLTGRTHQIRVHLKYIGHPIVSDEKYVGRKMYRLDKRWCPRQFLHAARIGFSHPVTGEWMEFESKLPEDLKRSLKLLNE